MLNINKKVLYISPDGMLEPLGDSQVLKYLEKLSAQFPITLISYEKINDLKDTKKLQEIQSRCEGHNISWNYKKYRQGKFLVSHALNAVNFIFFPILLMLRERFSIVHIRSYMPGLCIPLLSMLFNFKLLFDIRGFWADEKHDRLGWRKNSLKYIFFKKLEKNLNIIFENSDKKSLNNVKIGENVKIYDFVNAYNCEINDNSKIGTFVEIQKNAFIGKNCKRSASSKWTIK